MAASPSPRKRPAKPRAAPPRPVRVSLDDGRALARVREICLSLPDAHEKEAWGAPTFRVCDRLFAMFVDNHHADGRLALWCKAPSGAQAGLVESDPRRYFVPPYVGKSGWVGVRLDRAPSWPVVAALLAEGHRLAAPQRKARPRKAKAMAARKRTRSR